MKTVTLAMLSSMEKIVNQALKYDPATLDKMTALGDFIFSIKTTEPAFRLYIRLLDGEIMLLTTWEDEVDASMEGPLRSFIHLARETDKTKALMEHNIRVSGNSQQLTRLQHLLIDLHIDWEAALADRIGDLPGHLMADGIRFTGSLFNNAWQHFKRSGENYIREENQLLVNPTDFAQFSEQVSRLRFDTDRLEARVRQLLNHTEDVK
ncbi:ubiquinone biosynthesis accessory factor UbiJ [Gynuella sp.]|uniref:ubiquinone biosynthesis accessory factor UbiJ n=1 Tax=Gynuella sp. TaxID=2969146 RepID=UPI003D147E20